MVFPFSYFGSKATVPERVPTDTIIPVHSHDGVFVNTQMFVHFTLCFDDVLDVDKLTEALNKLLARPGWRKLGARMRRNENGKLEYHVPEKYTDERPAFTLTRATHDMVLSEHPLASKILRPSDKLQVSTPLSELYPLVFPEDMTVGADRWLKEDRPQLQTHFVSFNDATILTMQWMHTFWDALGRRAFLDAWTAVLEGREEDVPEFYGYDIDPLASVGALTSLTPKDESVTATEEEKSVLDGTEITGLGLGRFIFNMVWEMTVYRDEEIRTIFIPSKAFDKIRRSAFADLMSVNQRELPLNTKLKEPYPFLSDGDIIAAWMTKLGTCSQPWANTVSPDYTISLINMFGLRDLLAKTEPILLPKGTVYIANCKSSIESFYTLHEMKTEPVGIIAMRMRKNIIAQGTRAQIEASQRIHNAAMAKTGNPALFGAGSGNMTLTPFSNWTKGRMFDVDFSAAVKDSGDATQKPDGYRRGKPSYIQSLPKATKTLSLRNANICLGKDGGGNYWVSGTYRTETWKNIEKAIEELAEEEA